MERSILWVGTSPSRPAIADEMHFNHASIIVECSNVAYDGQGRRRTPYRGRDRSRHVGALQ